jgi:pimeloyl-ACP methyl ester carboxylesterase
MNITGKPGPAPANESAAVVGGVRNLEFDERMIPTRDGISLYVRDYPPTKPETGLPVFCLPGLTRNSKDFEIVAPRVASLGRRIVASDPRGRGRSDRDPNAERYNLSVYAQDALRVLDELRIERAVFLGASLGGVVTMVLAAVAPQRIAAAILGDVGPRLEQTGFSRIAGQVGRTAPVATWEAAAAASKALNGSAFPDAPESFWLRLARRTFRENADGSIETDYDPAITRAFAAQLGASTAAPPDMTPLFQALAGVPILVVHGAASDLLSSAGVAAMRAMKPDLSVVEVSGVGHAPTLEEPEAWEAIVDFLARAP